MPNKIRIIRDSVCAGDDITAPHETYFEIMPWQTLKAWLEQFKDYLPKQPDAIWTIRADDEKPLAFMTCDENRTPTIDTLHPYKLMSEINMQFIQCRHTCRYEYKNKYPDTMSLIEIKDDLMTKAMQEGGEAK